MSLSASLFGRDSFIHKATNILGLGIPGWLDKKFGPKDTEGPRLDDRSVQMSTYGAAIPRVYGTIGTATNLTWLENNMLRETTHKKKSGGKNMGGSSKPTKTYTYSASFMLSVCEGEIDAIGRIWCRDLLVYNPASTDVATLIESNKTAAGMRIYRGTDDQLPDPRYQAAKGVGNVPAFRGLAYIIFDDFQLENFGNSLEATDFKVEVYKTSQSVYPTIVSNSIIFNNVSSPNADFRATVGALPRNSTDAIMWDGFKNIYRVDQFGRARIISDQFPNMTDNISPTRQGLILGASEMETMVQFYAADIEPDGVHTQYWQTSAGTMIKGKGLAIYNSYVFGVDGDFYWGLNGFAGGTPSAMAFGKFVVVPGFPSEIEPPSKEYPASELALTEGWCGFDGELYVIIGGSLAGPSEFGRSLAVFDKALNLDRVTPLHGPGFSSLIYQHGAYCDGEYYYMPTGLNSLGPTPENHRQVARVNLATGYTDQIWLENPYDGYGFADAPQVIRIQNGLLYELTFAHYGNYPVGPEGDSARLVVHRLTGPSGNGMLLSDIVKDECALSGLILADDIDVSELTDMVMGYAVTGGTIRACLEPLQATYPFDVITSGYKIKFIPRSSYHGAHTVQYGDLVVGADSDKAINEAIEMATQLPQRTLVKYFDASREYAVSEQSFNRVSGEAVNKAEIDLAVVLSADKALSVAEVLTQLPWLERSSLKFTLPPTFQSLEPGDVIFIYAPNQTYQLRARKVDINANGTVEVDSTYIDFPLYVTTSQGGQPPPPSGLIPYRGACDFVNLDIPVIDETFQNTPGFVTTMFSDGPSWPGGTLLRSPDNGQTWEDLQGFSGEGTLGHAVNTLAVNDGTFIDYTPLMVGMVTGELESISRDLMLSGLHYAAYGVDGRWEIVRFANAELIAADTYNISGFVRGDKGTEWATGLHQVDDWFIILADPDNAFIGVPIINLEMLVTYGSITSGGKLEDLTQRDFTYKGVNLEPLSPVYPIGERDGSGSLTFSIQRRSRLSSSWWANGMEAPVGETSLALEADIIDGGTVKRTLTSSTGEFLYSSADQISDFGSIQEYVVIRIYQLSTVVGRGYPLEATL